ncbi:hypothetical protein [Nocardia asteroides]|uniref:hypothetical protein n=1 Tax=Nocardia asteroides TaxID=1824 RepID=UPI001E34841B|nr:hypothetical protein [Nocardia asteroides]UGT55396.1 hypothetical protein LTT85_00500 [Nocardia asteroides]
MLFGDGGYDAVVAEGGGVGMAALGTVAVRADRERRAAFSERRFERLVTLADGLSPESLEILIGFAGRLRAVEGVGIDPLVE